MTEPRSALFPPVMRKVGLFLLCLICFVAGRVVDNYQATEPAQQANDDAVRFEQEITQTLEIIHKDLLEFRTLHQDHIEPQDSADLQQSIVLFQQELENRNPFKYSYNSAQHLNHLKSMTSNTQPVKLSLVFKFKELPENSEQFKFKKMFPYSLNHLNKFKTTWKYDRRLIQLVNKTSQQQETVNGNSVYLFGEFEQTYLFLSKSKSIPQAAMIQFKSEYNPTTKKYHLNVSVDEFNL